ncbi:DUF1330 domain-containing protein [Litorisediminicola beolgyonensis]|uniref:DUF1330 domain-containing protein n=1 Tax=Litorisediminicola beolgyonensis TaxID=1173614 RepID=A0ABW3ZND0_9RHOB
MPALWIAHVHVTDADAYGAYAKLAGPAIAAHGGAFIARGGAFVTLEGNTASDGTEKSRHVVARFPSVEAAETCYHSDAYQEALSHARNASERDLIIVEINE